MGWAPGLWPANITGKVCMGRPGALPGGGGTHVFQFSKGGGTHRQETTETGWVTYSNHFHFPSSILRVKWRILQQECKDWGPVGHCSIPSEKGSSTSFSVSSHYPLLREGIPQSVRSQAAGKVSVFMLKDFGGFLKSVSDSPGNMTAAGNRLICLSWIWYFSWNFDQ